MLQQPPARGRARHLSWLLAPALLVALVPFELSARATAEPPVTAPVPAATPTPPPAPAAQAPVPQVPEQAPAAPTPAPEPTPAPAPRENASPGGLPSELRVVLDEMRRLSAELRQQRAARSAVYQDAVREFNALSQEADVLAGAYEAQLAEARLLREEQERARLEADPLGARLDRLGVQQNRVLQQLEMMAQVQRRLTEMQVSISEEIARLRESLSGR